MSRGISYRSSDDAHPVEWIFFGILLGALVGYGVFYVCNFRLQTKIEVLEKTCRYVTQ